VTTAQLLGFSDTDVCRLGYGGFSISIDPFFSAANLTFLQRYRGILAVPNIRGGDEFGEAWHWAGALHKKVSINFPNLFPL
jgi:prolyl oligopeptidase